MPIQIRMLKRLLFCLFGLCQFFVGGIAVDSEENLKFTGINKLVVEGALFSVEVAGYSGKVVEAQIIIPDRIFKDGVKVLHKQMNSSRTGRRTFFG